MLSMLLLIGGGCRFEQEVVEAPPAPVEEPALRPEQSPASADMVALAAATQAAGAVGGATKSRLQEAMAAGGPDAAMTACADEAQGLTALAGSSHRASVGRSSLRLRNPQNAGPDWVQAWLTEQGQRPAEGVGGLSLVVDTDEGRVARILRPIAVGGLCLNCHGAPETFTEGVKATLATRYPSDAATGYQAGDLRGAVWAEVPVKSVKPPAGP